jgi:hypothetical protein
LRRGGQQHRGSVDCRIGLLWGAERLNRDANRCRPRKACRVLSETQFLYPISRPRLRQRRVCRRHHAKNDGQLKERPDVRRGCPRGRHTTVLPRMDTHIRVAALTKRGLATWTFGPYRRRSFFARWECSLAPPRFI